VLKLASASCCVTGKITPRDGTKISGTSGVYDAEQLTSKTLKGDLLIPETIKMTFPLFESCENKNIGWLCLNSAQIGKIICYNQKKL